MTPFLVSLPPHHPIPSCPGSQPRYLLLRIKLYAFLKQSLVSLFSLRPLLCSTVTPVGAPPLTTLPVPLAVLPCAASCSRKLGVNGPGTQVNNTCSVCSAVTSRHVIESWVKPWPPRTFLGFFLIDHISSYISTFFKTDESPGQTFD